MPTVASSTWTGAQLVPYRNNDTAGTVAVNLAASQTLAAGTLMGELTGITDVQTIHASAQITGGTYTAGDGTNTTVAINPTDTAAQITAKLLAATPKPLPFVASGGLLSAGSPVDVTLTALGGGVHAALTITPTSITGGTLSLVHTTTGTAGTPGSYKPYLIGNTDGTQIPKGFLMYPVVVDASGNINIANTAGVTVGEFGQTSKTTPIYYSGEFDVTALVGLDANAVTALGGRMVSGTIGGTIATYNIFKF